MAGVALRKNAYRTKRFGDPTIEKSLPNLTCKLASTFAVRKNVLEGKIASRKD